MGWIRDAVFVAGVVAASACFGHAARAQDGPQPPAPAIEPDNQFADRTDATALYREAMASEMGKQLDALLSRMVMDPSYQQIEVDRILGSHAEAEVKATLEAMERAAQLDLPDARRTLGLWTAAGVKGEPDAEVGLRLITQAAEQGDAEAQWMLGFVFLGWWSDDEERPVATNPVESARWFRRAADAGHAGAQSMLGDAYASGNGVERDMSEAVRWWGMAARQRVPNALYRLALALRAGDGIDANLENARSLMQGAAETGLADAQYQLGLMELLDVEETIRDTDVAVRWLEAAAAQDHREAQFHLGLLYDVANYVPRNAEQAARWYRMAASPRALFDEALYARLQRDDPARAEYFLREHGGHPMAAFFLGQFYEKGDGVPQDYAQAAIWYQKAADRGLATAQSSLGSLYLDGRGVPQDDKIAFRLLHEAAQNGSLSAHTNLGFMYSEGRGTPQDDAQAVRWYRPAAEAGNAMSQYNLGICYAYGEGVPQDHVQAHKWLNLAGAGGIAEARDARDELSRRMTREQIAEAQRLAAEFVAKGEAESEQKK